MITALYVDNFKSWRIAGRIHVAPLTALFGTNSSGKTSLLQLLLMLKQTAESPDRNQVLNLGGDRSLAELGTYEEVVHNHALSEKMTLGLEWLLPAPLDVEDPANKGQLLFRGDALAFVTHLMWQTNGSTLGRTVVDRMAYSFSHAEFGMERSANNPSKYDLFVSDGEFRFHRARGRAWELSAPVKCYGFPDQVRAYYQNAGFLSDFELRLKRRCSVSTTLVRSATTLSASTSGPAQRPPTWAGAESASSTLCSPLGHRASLFRAAKAGRANHWKSALQPGSKNWD
ncbi:MAG TPA: hypothetical protein VKT77_03355 [Chthonomonadaceae bacterium]|nr:hypothetical protein [Chthonomonadaceae bacterium]